MGKKQAQPGNVEAFPQHAVKRPKPTVLELLNQDTPERAVALVRMAHPDITLAEFLAGLDREAATIRASIIKGAEHLAAINNLMNAARSEMADGTAQAGPDDTFDEDLKAAAKLDPYWHLDSDGTATPMQGATHKTPDDLVAAYRRNRNAT